MSAALPELTDEQRGRCFDIDMQTPSRPPAVDLIEQAMREGIAIGLAASQRGSMYPRGFDSERGLQHARETLANKAGE